MQSCSFKKTTKYVMIHLENNNLKNDSEFKLKNKNNNLTKIKT